MANSFYKKGPKPVTNLESAPSNYL